MLFTLNDWSFGIVPLNPNPRLPPFPNAPPTVASIFSLCLSKMLEISSSVFGILGICFTTLTSLVFSGFSEGLSRLADSVFTTLALITLVEEDDDPNLMLLLALLLLLSSLFFERDDDDPDCYRKDCEII